MVVWVEGSDKRKPTNGPVLKLFYDKETDQWVGPNDTQGFYIYRNYGASIFTVVTELLQFTPFSLSPSLIITPLLSSVWMGKEIYLITIGLTEANVATVLAGWLSK